MLLALSGTEATQNSPAPLPSGPCSRGGLWHGGHLAGSQATRPPQEQLRSARNVGALHSPVRLAACSSHVSWRPGTRSFCLDYKIFFFFKSE